MPAFAYTALSSAGESKKGSIDAADRGEVVRKLARMGLRASSVKPLGASAAPAAKEKPKDGKKAAAAVTKDSAAPFAALWQRLKSGGDAGKAKPGGPAGGAGKRAGLSAAPGRGTRAWVSAIIPGLGPVAQLDRASPS